MIAVAISLLTALVAGCGKRSVNIRVHQAQERSIRVQGSIIWQGDSGAPKVDITAVPHPIGSTRIVRYEQAVRAEPGQSRASYKMKLRIESRATIIRDERWHGIPFRHFVYEESSSIARYSLRVTPPPGWTVTPAERAIIVDTTGADFVLTPGAVTHEFRP